MEPLLQDDQGEAPVADEGRDSESFQKRLADARGRHGMDAPAAGSPEMSAKDGNALGIGLRVGVEMLSALVVALAIGWYLDRWLHTSPLFLVVFVLLGGVAGIANVWRTVGPKKPPAG